MSFRSSVLDRRRLLALAVIALAFAVRVWDIRARALWFDEASEYWVATAPVSQLVESARTGSGDPPLYSFLLHAWMQLGSSELWLRLLSALVSVSGVAAVMVLAGMFSGPVAAIGAGLLLAVLPADVRYAQEVGQYGFIPAIVGWNLVCLFNLVRRGTWRWVFGWAATALAGAYLYYAMVFPIAAAFLCVVAESIFRRDMRARRATGTALVLCVLGLLPLLISYLPTQLARVVGGGGVSIPVDQSGGFLGLLRAKWAVLSGLIAFQFTGWPHTLYPSAVSILGVVGLIGLGVRRSPRLFVWLVAATIAYAVASAAGLFPLGYRWGLILTPLIICAMAAGLAAGAAMRARWATVAVFAVLFGICVISLPNRSLHDRVYRKPAAWPETEDMRVVAGYWMAHRTPDQPTYVYYGAAPAFAYYTRTFAPRKGLPSTWYLACWHEKSAPAYCREDGIYYGRWGRGLDINGKVASVFETIGRPASFWIVFGHMVPGDDRNMINEFMRERYRVDAAVEAVNATACLLVRQN